MPASSAAAPLGALRQAWPRRAFVEARTGVHDTATGTRGPLQPLGSRGLMDALRSYHTSAQAITGFANTQYAVYTVSRVAKGFTKDHVSEPRACLPIIEGTLHADRRLVIADLDAGTLWEFRGADGAEESSAFDTALTVEGYELQAFTTGRLSILDLARHAVRNASSPANATVRGVNPRFAQHHLQQSNKSSLLSTNHSPDPSTIYANLIAAITATVSYRLARHFRILPLNAHTFVNLSADDDGLSSFAGDSLDDNKSDQQANWLVSLDVHIASSGTLVISTGAVAASRIVRQLKWEETLQLRNSGREKKKAVGRLVRLAPCGIVAKVLGPADTDGLTGDNGNSRWNGNRSAAPKATKASSRRKRPRAGLSPAAVVAWKRGVDEWLRAKGIFLQRLYDEDEHAWVSIRLPRNTNRRRRECIWPTALCFYYCNNDSESDVAGRGHAGSTPHGTAPGASTPFPSTSFSSLLASFSPTSSPAPGPGPPTHPTHFSDPTNASHTNNNAYYDPGLSWFQPPSHSFSKGASDGNTGASLANTGSNTTALHMHTSSNPPTWEADPLAFAESWLLRKPSRDRELEQRRHDRAAEVAAAAAQAQASTEDDNANATSTNADAADTTHPGGGAPSPMFVRGAGNGYGDLAALGGVYPTPPDGIVGGGANTSAAGATAASSGPLGAGVTVTFGGIGDGVAAHDMMDLDGAAVSGPAQSAIAAVATSAAAETPELASRLGSNASVHQNMAFARPGDMQDLFEDMDDDFFGGGGVTEADFSYFDDPGDDVGEDDGFGNMGENEGEQEHDEVKGEGEQEERLGEHSSKMHTKLEMEAGDNLEAEQAETLDDGGQLKAADSAQPHANEQNGDDEDSSSCIDAEDDEVFASPPLTPGMLQQRLFHYPKSGLRRQRNGLKDMPGGSAPDVAGGRRQSMFDPLHFSSRMLASDAKYTAESGRFFKFTAPTNRALASSPLSPTKLNTNIPNTSALNPLPNGHSASSPTSTKYQRKALGDEEQSLYSSDETDDFETVDYSVKSPYSTVAPSTSAKRKFEDGTGSSQSASPSASDADIDGIGASVDSSTLMIEEDFTKFCAIFERSISDWALVGLPPPKEISKKPISKSHAVPEIPNYNNPSSAAASPSYPYKASSPYDIDGDTLGSNPREFIGICQLLSEQIVFSTLDLVSQPPDPRPSAPPRDISVLAEKADTAPPEKAFKRAVTDVFPTATNDCDILKYVAIGDAAAESSSSASSGGAAGTPGANKQPPRPLAARRINAPDGVPGSPGIQPANAVFPIRIPQVRVYRNDSLWDLLPTALSFWETLGLAPAAGPKNLMAYCVFPFSTSGAVDGSSDDGVRDAKEEASLRQPLDNFLGAMASAFETCKLGMHVRGAPAGQFEDGLVPVKADGGGPVTLQAAMRAYRKTCIQLGHALITAEATARTAGDGDTARELDIDSFVIYLINPFTDPRALWHLCASAWALFQTFQHAKQQAHRAAKQSNRSTEPSPDLIIQILPLSHLASPSRIVVPDPSATFRLAREVYDRAPPGATPQPGDYPPDRAALRTLASASVRLEEQLPRGPVPFRLQADPPQHLLLEHSWMHVGYAVGLDSDGNGRGGEWASAAWTDNAGKYQATATYCLKGGRKFADVAKEIWGTTVEMVAPRKVTWRVAVAKAGVMEKEEVDVWSALAAQHQPSIYTVLTSIDLHPTLNFTSTSPAPSLPLLPSAPSTATSGPSAAVHTPASVPTPQSQQYHPSPAPDPGTLTPSATTATTPSATTGSAAPTSGLPDPFAQTDVTSGALSDPEARLIDLSDDAWGLLLGHRRNVARGLGSWRPALLSGVLAKRGRGSATAPTSWDGGAGAPDTASSLEDEDMVTPGLQLVGVNVVWATGFARAAAGHAGGPVGLGPQGADGAPAQAHQQLQHQGPLAPQTQQQQQAAVALRGGNLEGGLRELLRELLTMYRGLGVLAKVRGMRGGRGGVVPWHVLAAVRAVKGMERCVP
ncbi:mediator complex subunit 13 C-terminal-domain-containing protein [Lineolata rhizophorae]|uniref:Mediator of RNA polymerase II transcription subunit 13 n=1 Tax=Lineolata rhizophorae TaxID=578093 RepID=A0A6A6NMK1_9PEZI|nr:mediator complex subunit 13 C-terminal-domain-containing protein [Lineolata rhizophorae]